jgi:aminopeptidase N
MKRINMAIVFLIVCAASLFAQKIDIYKRPVQVERSRDFDAQHYRLTLTFDLDKKEFWGENKVTLKSLKDEFKECVLDAKELVVTEVVNHHKAPLKFDQTDEKLVVSMSRTYNYGEEATFTIKYYAKDPKKGFFFSDETPRNPKMVSTDSFPDEARHWFPCYDYPHDKVTMELIATVQKPNKVLSNGRLVSIRENDEDNSVTYHWHQDKPHSTYLSMVAIAPFTVIKDSLGSLPINYWVYEKDVEDARRIFKKTPYMIDFFNKLYGYEYPWAKYDQVETPTQGGGAEATSATILGQNVIYDEKADKDFSWETTIAHEIAHQWWGDLVTLRTWSEAWLNESFGTYSDYLYTRFDKGEDEGAFALLGKKNSYLREAHERYIRPIVFNRYENPGQNFDRHTYPKGACVLHMLRFVLGDKPFFRTLRHFLHKHEFQPVDTHDLMIAVKESTGQNLDWFFEQFIYKPGHPEFEISYEWKKSTERVRVKVAQVQDFSLGIPVYKIPVAFGITTSKGKAIKKVWIQRKEEVFEFTADEKPLMVRFDDGNFLLKEWTFDKEMDELLYQLKYDDVIGRMWAASELVRFEGNPRFAEELAERIQKDPFWAVRRSALDTLSKVEANLNIDLIKTVCIEKNSKVRTTALQILGDTKDSELVPFFKERFKKEDSYVAQAEALRSIGKCGDRSQISFLKNAAEMESPRNVIKRAAEWALKELMKDSDPSLSANKDRPNIVFIFIDDLGWKDVGYMGSKYYETPTIDKLARQGMMFTNAYANAANCAPSRASLLCGQYSPRHGVYTVASSARGKSEYRRLIPIENRSDVDLAKITIAEALRNAGYASAAIGKWHIGQTPEQHGFDFGIDRDAFNIKGHFSENGDYLADILTDEAISFIKRNNPKTTKRPFFLYLSHHAVHTPIRAKKNKIEAFEKKPADDCHNSATYAAMIQSVDESVARIQEALEELRLDKNTLLIFFSDNGGHGTYTCQNPLRGGKGMFYEGGIRVPMFVYWPGTIEPDSTCEEPVMGIDFYPTFLQLAGISAPQDYILDGTSILPLLKGEKTMDRGSLYWHFPAYLQAYKGMTEESRDPIFRTRPVSVIRKQDWKLLMFHEEWALDGGNENVDRNNSIELYNLKDDIEERNNLAHSNSAKRDELLKELVDWQKSIKAPVPTKPNPEYVDNNREK